MFGMNEAQLRTFLEKVSATAIANQAILKCKIVGAPLTVDNAIFFVGDFFDPSNPEFESMIDAIYDAIVYVVGQPEEAPGLNDRSDDNVIRLLC